MSAFVNAQQVFVNVNIPTRVECLDFLATKAVELNFANNKDTVLEAYIAREEEGPTGLTDGFAIPHAKSEAITKAGVIVVKLTQAIEWPDFDEKPCDILISLLIPAADANTTHLKLLSQIAVMLMDEDFKVALRSTDDPEEIANMITERLDV